MGITLNVLDVHRLDVAHMDVGPVHQHSICAMDGHGVYTKAQIIRRSLVADINLALSRWRSASKTTNSHSGISPLHDHDLDTIPHFEQPILWPLQFFGGSLAP